MRPTPHLLWLVNTEKGFTVLKDLASKARDSLGLVSSYSDPNVKEDFGSQIAAFCRVHQIDHVLWSSLRTNPGEWLQRHKISGIVAIGWQYLIAHNVWSALPHKLIIFHDSLLPRYRGFAPLATGLIKGETEFGVSVIYAGQGTDDGPIILQESVHLGEDVYIQEAITAMSRLYGTAALRLIDRLVSGPVAARPQDESKATYSLWRGADDCVVDWKCSARQIYNLVRAVGPPYPGAFSQLDGKRVYIWRSEPLDQDLEFEIRDAGKIWKIEKGRPTVVCGRGMLRLTELTDADGTSLLPVTRMRVRFG